MDIIATTTPQNRRIPSRVTFDRRIADEYLMQC